MSMKQDDSRPFSTTNMEQPIFSPELQSEKMKEIQEAAVAMVRMFDLYVQKYSARPLDNLYDQLWYNQLVIGYLAVAGETLGRPFVKTAFSMAIRNYINSKE